MANARKIAFLGQPNSGKSTIFNALTGAHQHVGNWPGKTVEKKEGSFTHNGVSYQVADLPGSYSLSANSDEEIVTRDYIASGGAELVCILADASQLERSLFMLADYAGIRTPAMLVLTMMDVAQQQGKSIDTEQLSKKLGIPVVGLVAPEKKNYGAFYKTLEDALKSPKVLDASKLYEIYGKSGQSALFQEALELVPAGGIGQYSTQWLASKLIEGDRVAARKVAAAGSKEQVEALLANASDGSLFTSEYKFSWISALLEGVVTRPKGQSAALTKFDKIALSRRWGKWLAVGIILLGLVASMIVAMPIMAAGSLLSSSLKALFAQLASAGVSALVVEFINGVLVTAFGFTVQMLGFVFGINTVFGLIEEMGYMARISYAFDNTMNRLGLQGKSIMPLLVGFGCTIGGAASARVIDSWGQKVLTIALVWAVPCAATFTVIPTLATAFFGWGGILVMLLIIGIMFLHIAVTARVFGGKLSPKAERTGLIMELPPYHKPRWGYLVRQVLNRVWGVFKKAIIVVVLVAAVFWLLSYSPTGNAGNSLLYRFGAAIEPVTRFFSMGWQTFIAFVASMISKEAVLGVFSVLFVGGGSLFESTIGTAAASGDALHVMVSVLSKPEALAFIVALTFNVPCIVALAATYTEAHSLKWTLRIVAYYIFTALLLSFITYHVAGLFW